MNILLVNDDGIYAEGIIKLAEALKDGHRVVIAAPDKQCSGFASSMYHRITVKKADLGISGVTAYKVAGTPVNCATIGVQKLFPEADAVISGINAGRNAGPDILYSGTVGAALEAALYGYRSIAVSLRTSDHMKESFLYSADFMKRNLDKLCSMPIPEQSFININFPSELPPRGIRTARAAETDIKDYLAFAAEGDPGCQETVYTVSGRIKKPVYAEGTDLLAVKEGYISLSVLKIARDVSVPEAHISDLVL